MLVAATGPSLRPPSSLIRDQAPRGADPSPSQPSASGSAQDLREEIRERIEQDPDYQILRRSFALAEERDLKAESSATVESTGAVSVPQPPVGIDLSGFEVESSGQRLELHIRADESGKGQRLTLEIVSAEAVQRGDPLALDLSGMGFTTTGIAGGVDFDLDGDGLPERMSTVYGGTWFLALDRNDNGRIDDGRELFGDQNGARHGFAELARYDDNSDGRIDRQDQVFSRLRLLQLKADGGQVLKTLEEAGVAAIELNHREVQKALSAYDQIAQLGRFIRNDGTTGQAADLLLGYRTRA